MRQLQLPCITGYYNHIEMIFYYFTIIFIVYGNKLVNNMFWL